MLSLIRSLRRCVAILPMLAPAMAAAQTDPIAGVAWMAGCWGSSTPSAVIDEQWMQPRGGTTMGMSRTVARGGTREYEFMRIFAAGDTLVYAAYPAGQPPAEFRAVKRERTSILFENKGHDFPQRISYRAAGKDSLIATIEGPMNGQTRQIVFAYARQACAR